MPGVQKRLNTTRLGAELLSTDKIDAVLGIFRCAVLATWRLFKSRTEATQMGAWREAGEQGLQDRHFGLRQLNST